MEIKDFINRIVPTAYQTGDCVTKRGRILANEEYLLPDDVLRTDPFFEYFRNYKPEKQHCVPNSAKNTNVPKKKYILSSDR